MNKRFSLILKGGVLSVILTVMFSLLLALAVYFFDVSERLVTTLVFLVCSLSAMSGAYAASRALGSKGLLCGGAVGIIYYIVIAVLAFILKKGFSFDSHFLIMLVCSSSSGMLGGVLGMPR